MIVLLFLSVLFLSGHLCVEVSFMQVKGLALLGLQNKHGLCKSL